MAASRSSTSTASDASAVEKPIQGYDFSPQSDGPPTMRTLKFTYWQDGDFFIGYLNEYPDYQTQGSSKAELIENLKDLLVDLESGQVPFVHKVEELQVA
jgi:hypothetical protein